MDFPERIYVTNEEGEYVVHDSAIEAVEDSTWAPPVKVATYQLVKFSSLCITKTVEEVD